MSRPFPTSPAGRREAFDKMVQAAPGLPASIANLKQQFPDAKLVYFQAGDIEFGQRPVPGVVPNIAPTDAEIKEKHRKGKR